MRVGRLARTSSRADRSDLLEIGRIALGEHRVEIGEVEDVEILVRGLVEEVLLGRVTPGARVEQHRLAHALVDLVVDDEGQNGADHHGRNAQGQRQS